MLKTLWVAVQPWLIVILVLGVSGAATWWALFGQDLLRRPWGTRAPRGTPEESCAPEGGYKIGASWPGDRHEL